MNTHLESTLYYTLSTVAQTLAGAIGLLGAIVLFSLQATAKSIERAARDLTQIPHETLSALYIRHLFSRRSYTELAQRYAELLTPRFEVSTDVLVSHSTLTWELQHEQAIRRSFWRALVASGLVIALSISLIALSISLIALAPQLAEREVLGKIALAAVVGGAMVCLVLYALLLRIVLNASPDESTEKP